MAGGFDLFGKSICIRLDCIAWDLMNREKGRGKRYPLTASTEAGLAAPLEMKLWQNLGYWEVFRLDVQVWGLKCVKICLHRWAKSPDNGLAVMNI